jgi:hypothetical protein
MSNNTSTAEIPPRPDDVFKLLEKEFSKNGFKYVQVKRHAALALYAVKSEFGGTVGYEVVLIKIAQATFMKITGSWVPEREIYPGNEEFGQRGWYWPVEVKERAFAKYEELLNGKP